MKFDMSIEDNYASFIDEETGQAVFVDSFDNEEFDIRIGTVTESESAGSIFVTSTEELNRKLEEIYQNFKERNNGYSA